MSVICDDCEIEAVVHEMLMVTWKELVTETPGFASMENWS